MKLTNVALKFDSKLTPLILSRIDGIVFHHMDHETADVQTIDYSQGILPPLPSFLPLFAKEFTRLRQRIYQHIKKPYRLTF